MDWCVIIKQVTDRLGTVYMIVRDKQSDEFYWVVADQSESEGPYATAEDAERSLPRP